MKYSFHPDARRELFEAINYYDECQEGLGFEFAGEIYSTIQRIVHFSEAWSKSSKNTRKCLTNRFPYGVIYQIAEKEIIIIAIMQLNRKPNYWEKRIK
ncbi:MAG: type II toxin-antitoxin system RelE/ParE family toxin [Candidatus Scalindua sp.]|nr:type II toxin-antitoxin system RelE/ParE family toxin [Candidatus Scalindua sp.]